jgi:hypothetical protein
LTVASADPWAYESEGNDDWGTIDLATGQFTYLGNSGQLLSGLGSYAGGLFGGVEGSTSLYQVDPLNGDLALVGTGSYSYWDTGSTLTGLYGTDRAGDVFSIDPNTGAQTLIGNDGIQDDVTVLGMSSGGSDLYISAAVSGGEDLLYRIDTSNAAATEVGAVTGNPGFGAMVYDGGSLFGGGDLGGYGVYSIDPSNGSASLIAPATGMSSDFWGLAQPTSVTPAPLAALPFLAGLISHRRRRSNSSKDKV